MGFLKLPAGNLQFVVANDNAGGTAVVEAHNVVLAADIPAGYNKLGFRVNADRTVEIYVNEKRITHNTAGVAFSVSALALPIESLTQKFVVGRGSGAATTVALPIDWVSCFVGD
jgi:hypothetical protein